MGKHEPHFAPRLMPAPEAAHYLGVSMSKLLTLGIPRKMLGAKRLFDRLDLDTYASDLPTEAATPKGNTCDAVFD
ncbi:DNA-binding protein [Phaeovulum sp. W22_SRMD_FR3]|uniref:DNA-binding protein n=1 Tax=Phaeovulum sp. W22_SRMD_FR3 TaxID=3240274 RepID=UPI003F9A2DA2